MNLLFCINKGYVNHFLNCLRSIELNGGADHYDVHILHSDLDPKVMERIQASANCSSFYYYKIDESIFSGFPEFRRYPKQIYYRLVSALILPKELDRILYLDADLIVINPLKELYETDFEGNWFGACTHTNPIFNVFNQVRLGVIEPGTPYINTGVVLMNLPLLRENIKIEDIRDYVKYHKFTFILPDQDIIYGLYGDHIKLLDTLKYNLSDRVMFFHNSDPMLDPITVDWVRENTVIIHYCGKNKPWNKKYVGLLNIFYDELKPFFLSAPQVTEPHYEPDEMKLIQMSEIEMD